MIEVISMNEFEQKIISMLDNVDTKLSKMDARISKIESDMTDMKNDISEMKENLEITRVAANYNGEKLEEITDELKKMHVIS